MIKKDGLNIFKMVKGEKLNIYRTRNALLFSSGMGFASGILYCCIGLWVISVVAFMTTGALSFMLWYYLIEKGNKKNYKEIMI